MDNVDNVDKENEPRGGAGRSGQVFGGNACKMPFSEKILCFGGKKAWKKRIHNQNHRAIVDKVVDNVDNLVL